MTKTEVINYFGSVTATARAIGVTHASVCGWVNVPIGRQFQIELLTEGALKASPKDQHVKKL